VRGATREAIDLGAMRKALRKPMKKPRNKPTRRTSGHAAAASKAWSAVKKQTHLAKSSLDRGALGDAISQMLLGAYFEGKAHMLDGRIHPVAAEMYSSVGHDAYFHQVAAETIDAGREASAGLADRTLRELQATLPWTVHYHHDFRASPMAHKDFGHALLHVMKAAGKLAALVNDAEHGGCEFTAEQTDPYIADLVVCALRMANTCPGRTVDLQRAVIDRIEIKNKTKLPRRSR